MAEAIPPPDAKGPVPTVATTGRAQPVEEQTPSDHGGHPDEILYIKVALVLFVITAAEVGVYYIESLKGHALVIILLTMAVVKFVLVAMYFMHLKFDNPIFRRLFLIGIGLAIGVYMIVLTTLHVWSR
jgi:cytochrome c oxidase subunit 4